MLRPCRPGTKDLALCSAGNFFHSSPHSARSRRIVEIAAPSIAGIKPEAPVAMTLDIEGPPRLITVSPR